jgi:hypothetical protein
MAGLVQDEPGHPRGDASGQSEPFRRLGDVADALAFG